MNDKSATGEVAAAVFRRFDETAARARVAAFERQYGVPSDRLADAFMADGRLIETDDFHDWSSLDRMLAAVTSARMADEEKR